MSLVGARTLQREIRKGAGPVQMRKGPEPRQAVLILPWLTIPFFFRNLAIVESAITNSKVNVGLLHCSLKGGGCLRTHRRCLSHHRPFLWACWVVTSLQLPEEGTSRVESHFLISDRKAAHIASAAVGEDVSTSSRDVI